MAGYRLYGWRQTGSMVIEAALEEAGVAYQLIGVDRRTDENLRPEFTAINPRQQLPALMTPDGTVVTEGPAILSHIADAFPQARLSPAPGSSARASHDRWAGFFHANVYEAMLREAYPARYVDDPAAEASLVRAATAFIHRHFLIYDAALGDGPFLSGGRMQMIDLYVWMLTWWVNGDWLASSCPRVSRMQAAVQARTVPAAVWQRHFG